MGKSIKKCYRENTGDYSTGFNYGYNGAMPDTVIDGIDYYDFAYFIRYNQDIINLFNGIINWGKGAALVVTLDTESHNVNIANGATLDSMTSVVNGHLNRFQAENGKERLGFARSTVNAQPLTLSNVYIKYKKTN